MAENPKHNFKVYQVIRNNGGWDNWSMILIENYPCNNKLEAEQRERYWIETLQATLNQIIPTRTKQEYREENKEHILNQKKEYYQLNKDKHREWSIKQKEYRNTKHECSMCGGSFLQKHKAQHEKTLKHQNALCNPCS